MRMSTWIPGLATLFLAAFVSALPGKVSQSATNDDTTLWITTLNKMILGDVKSWCQVRVEIKPTDVKITAGDEIEIWVYEDDTAGDDLLFHTTVKATAEEAAAKHFDRTFDCSSNFGDDVGEESEIFAEAEFRAKDCGTWCLYDTPETKVVTVAEVEDDGREPDNAAKEAKAVGLGTTADLICRDQDWHSVELASPTDIDFVALHDPSVGKLDVALLDASGNPVVQGVQAEDGTHVTATKQAAGKYFFRVQPFEAKDYNFYDIKLTVQAAAACTAGEQQTEDCGNCGKKTRTCNADGTWGEFQACANEGACKPGDEGSDPCGNCGTQKKTCSDKCAWVQEACAGEGECKAGAKETKPCAGGEQERKCDTHCKWGNWSDCPGECTEGATEACYSGPSNTKNVGLCKEGKKTCKSGKFGACEGEVVPVVEVCSDGKDNDCDGKTDAGDDDCKTALGAPCADKSDCGADYECLEAPDYPMFKDGYCGSVGCTVSKDCGTGGLCGKVFGKSFCLKTCTGTTCRDGYVCAALINGKACIPKCTKNEDCADPAKNTCDTGTGLCEAGPAQPDAGTDAAIGTDVVVLVDGFTTDVGKDAGTKPGSSGGGGCGAGTGTGGGLAILLLGVVALARRRVNTR